MLLSRACAALPPEQQPPPCALELRACVCPPAGADNAFQRLEGVLRATSSHVCIGGKTDASDRFIEPTLLDYGTDMAAFAESAAMQDEVRPPHTHAHTHARTHTRTHTHTHAHTHTRTHARTHTRPRPTHATHTPTRPLAAHTHDPRSLRASDLRAHPADGHVHRRRASHRPRDAPPHWQAPRPLRAHHRRRFRRVPQAAHHLGRARHQRRHDARGEPPPTDRTQGCGRSHPGTPAPHRPLKAATSRTAAPHRPQGCHILAQPPRADPQGTQRADCSPSAPPWVTQVNHELPFGGVGASGMGSYHGHRSFLAFTHEKAVLEKSPMCAAAAPAVAGRAC
eukprot:5076814-Prymnesium_polylepis.1